MNLGKSQAQFDRFYGPLVMLLCMARELKERKDKFTRERTQILNENDATSATPHFTAVTLTGVVYPTTTSIGNTSNDGLLYVRFVANSSNWDVNLYTGTGASGLVAHATNVAASGTSALTADNSSGLGGSITLGATIAAEANDRHRLRIVKDYPARLQDVFPQDGTITFDAAYSAICKTAMTNVASSLDAAIAAVEAGLEQLMLNTDDAIGLGNSFLTAAETILYRESFTTDSSANVTLSKSGLFERLRLAMNDNTTAQTVLKRTITVGSATFSGDGTGTRSTVTTGERCPAGRVVLQVTKGIDTGDLGKERWDGYYAVDESGDTRNVPLNGIVIGATFNGPFGLQFQITRSMTKTNDGSNTKAAAASTFTVSGENNTNCPAGVLYCKITGSSGNFTYSFYSNSSYNSAYLVSQATGVAAAGAITATPQGSGGVTVTGTAGSAPAAADTWDLNLKPFYVDNSSHESDRLEWAITVAASPGIIQTTLSRLPLLGLSGGPELPSASSSPTLPDAKIVAGCFPPFIAQDN